MKKTKVEAPVQEAPKKVAPKAVKAPAQAKTFSQVRNSISSKPVAHGVGRRKSSVARVWLRAGSGNFVVNGKEVNAYFDTVESRYAANHVGTVYPPVKQMYDIEANVIGGGMCSQADAVKLGVARAIVKAREEARQVLRDLDLLTVDSRVKERKKPGQPAARKKFQFVKR